MEYSAFLSRLQSLAEENFRAFQVRSLQCKSAKVLGVRTQYLRAMVKEYRGEWESFLSFPDEYYEVKFVKINLIATLPYEKFISYLPVCVACMDSWALCDSFKPNCIAGHEADHLAAIEKYFHGGEGEQRFALVTLLYYYVSEPYLPLIFEKLRLVDDGYFYVHTACAWLMAEVLVKYFAQGVEWLKLCRLSVKTHNKAIQKARESFRLSEAQKEILLSLRRKK